MVDVSTDRPNQISPQGLLPCCTTQFHQPHYKLSENTIMDTYFLREIMTGTVDVLHVDKICKANWPLMYRVDILLENNSSVA